MLYASFLLCINLGPSAEVDHSGIAQSYEEYMIGSTGSAAQSPSCDTLEQRQETPGHNNYHDVASLPKLAKGMTIVSGPGPCSTEEEK